MKRFRTCDLNQPYLMPPSLQDWLPENHLARFLAEILEQVDLSAIYAHYERKDGRGLAAYHPLMMTRLLLYGYCVGKPSSRQIEKATYEEVPFRYLAANQHPDHDTIASFRQEHLESLGNLFVEVLRLCRAAGLVKLGHVALDGTKIEANASRQRSVSYERLQEQEQELGEQVARLLAEAAQADREEDERYGKGQPREELPPELARAEQRLAKIREARAALEQEARQRVERAQQERAAAGGKPRSEAEKKRWQRAKKQSAKPTGQYNFTDPDSRVMLDNGTKRFVQAYNAQAAVDGDKQVIVAATVTQQVADKEQLVPMVQQVEQRLGEKPQVLSADAGYFNTAQLKDESLQGMHVLVSPDGGNPAVPAAQLPATAPRNATAQQMRERLASAPGRALYRMRKAIVEPVFAQIKELRRMRRFLLRGLAQVRAEWQLICLTHNLLKLYRHGWLPAAV